MSEFYNCEFCNCYTNAKARACCDKGRDADRANAGGTVADPTDVEALEQKMKEQGVLSPVVELDDRRKVWQTWWTVCLACGHNAVSIQHEDTNGFLQCGKCKVMKCIKTAPATDAPVSTRL